MAERTLLEPAELARLVHGSVMMDLSAIGEKVMLDMHPTIDGLMQAIAQLAVESGMISTPKEERLFADRMRDALKAHIKDARNRPEELRSTFPIESGGIN